MNQILQQAQNLNLIQQVVQILRLDRENVQAVKNAVSRMRTHRRESWNILRLANVNNPWTVDFVMRTWKSKRSSHE